MEAINAAGVKKIDFLISTHYHGDHVGGAAEVGRVEKEDAHRNMLSRTISGKFKPVLPDDRSALINPPAEVLVKPRSPPNCSRRSRTAITRRCTPRSWNC